MSMLYLVLIWAVLGVATGGLALVARSGVALRGKYGALKLLLLALAASLLGGLFGFWAFGRLFSSATALWLATLAVCVPGLYAGLRKRLLI